MRFVILGSSGCVSLPRPLCRCIVCEEARDKGALYARRGCSMYLQDAHLKGKSYGDYQRLAGQHPGLQFAHDGMQITLRRSWADKAIFGNLRDERG